MADQPLEGASSTFPDPPPFWRDFTTDKIERMESLRSRYADQTGLDASTVIRVPNVPEDLTNLQPPAEPADGKWRLFGMELTVRARLFLPLVTNLQSNPDHVAQGRTPKSRIRRHRASSPFGGRARGQTHRPCLRPQAARQVAAPQLPRADGRHGHRPGTGNISLF